MATKPKKWPHNMAWARDGADEAIQASIRQLKPLLSHKDIAVVARVGIALASQQEAMRHLERAGASTRPSE